MESDLQTPVLFIVFNRPSTTRQVFDAIRKAKPRKLFIAADGPRENIPGELEKCLETRTIATTIDWECDVTTLFREKNLGCGKGPANAITWFFSQVEEGIILEDDCLPSPDFFPFCSQLLEKYRFDSRVMQIGGNNLKQWTTGDEDYSYFFSNHNYIWGWATWRRAWKLFHFNMEYYDIIKQKHYHDHYYKSFDEQAFSRYVFDETYADLEQPTVWDFQWQYSRMLQGGLSIVPYRNLVINVGYGSDATHTSKAVDILPYLKLERTEFPLRHPEFIMAHAERDEKIFCSAFTTPWSRLKTRLKKFVPDLLIKPAKSLNVLSSKLTMRNLPGITK